MTATSVCLHVVCPTCEGGGEVAGPHYTWENQATETCRTCHGEGTVRWEEAEQIREATCEHGEVETDDHDCFLCVQARHPYVSGPNPWRDGAATVVGGWEAEPPW